MRARRGDVWMLAAVAVAMLFVAAINATGLLVFAAGYAVGALARELDVRRARRRRRPRSWLQRALP